MCDRDRTCVILYLDEASGGRSVQGEGWATGLDAEEPLRRRKGASGEGGVLAMAAAGLLSQGHRLGSPPCPGSAAFIPLGTEQKRDLRCPRPMRSSLRMGRAAQEGPVSDCGGSSGGGLTLS